MFDCASAQWIGKRTEQEDVVLNLPVGNGMLGIICDGMGGHLNGARAAGLVASVFADCFSSAVELEVPQRMRHALESANQALADSQDDLEESGTTLLAVYAEGEHLWWISVGDSPLYLWSGDDRFQMTRLNEDHSMRPIVNQLYKQGRMTLQGALRQWSVLRSAVMGGELTLVDVCEVPLKFHKGDVVLACSDGLQIWNEILREPSYLALQKSADHSAQALVDTIMEQTMDMLEPRQDNASVWVVISR